MKQLAAMCVVLWACGGGPEGSATAPSTEDGGSAFAASCVRSSDTSVCGQDVSLEDAGPFASEFICDNIVSPQDAGSCKASALHGYWCCR